MRPEHAIVETESTMASTPMATSTIFTVLETRDLRAFLRAVRLGFLACGLAAAASAAG